MRTTHATHPVTDKTYLQLLIVVISAIITVSSQQKRSERQALLIYIQSLPGNMSTAVEARVEHLERRDLNHSKRQACPTRPMENNG